MLVDTKNLIFIVTYINVIELSNIRIIENCKLTNNCFYLYILSYTKIFLICHVIVMYAIFIENSNN